MNLKETEDHWEDVEKRKQFLLGFANKIGFDPLVPDNWHSKKVPQLRAYGVNALTNANDSTIHTYLHPFRGRAY